MNLQLVIVLLAVAAAAAYALWRILDLWRHRNNPCRHCSGCPLKQQIMEGKTPRPTNCQATGKPE